MEAKDLFFDIPEKLLSLAQKVQEIMFKTIEIGDTEVSMWAVIGGVGLLAILLFSIIKS